MKNIYSLKKVAFWAKKDKTSRNVNTECSISACGCGVECGSGLDCGAISCAPGKFIKVLKSEKTR